MPEQSAQSRSRRTFLKLVPATIGAGLALPKSTHARPEQPSPVTKDDLEGAERLAGISFNDSEREMMRQHVATNRDHFEALRRVPIGYDVEPAFTFKPYRRPSQNGRSSHERATPHTRLRIDRPRASTRPSDEDLAFMPVASLAGLVESRVVSSIELTELYLARLKKYGDVLHCVVTLTEDLAREQAAQADREIRSGRYRGPLHGIPYGIKDLFATKGIRTTWGAKPYENEIASADATAVQRLRDAGAVLVAKLSTGELAYGDVWFGGRTRNPWNIERGSSGSSAGPAAATAAGLVGFAVGTETGGSIISPAHTCGVVGLRPTYGRVSRHGVMTLRWTMDKIGPLARSVEDCAFVLNALYGPDGRDETVVDLPFVWDRNVQLAGLTIGFVQDEFASATGEGTEDERRRWPGQKRVLAAALDALRGSGARLKPVTMPDFPSRAMYAILNAEAGAAFDDMIRAGKLNDLAGKGPNDRANQLRISRLIPAVEYIRAQRARALLGRRMEDVMTECDVFLAPATSASVTTTNLTGHPAVTVNAGFADRLPVGLMVSGRLYEEATMLGVAAAYERARGVIDDRPHLTGATTSGGGAGARRRP
ncbi:MAG TPA: amidase [Vicinamibacterales bacterium]|nr:amidase [Vicinamibacterales bacterium]